MAFKFTDEAPELNITPLVDIMLVLLAIVDGYYAKRITYQEDITLPDGSKAKTSMSKQKDLIVSINAQRQVKIDQSLMSLAELPDNIALMSAKYDKTAPIYIKADKNLKYDDVMFVLKTLKGAGFSKVALETNG